ncbi:MAG: cytochrome c3 family protein [Bdellovibrionales bacterium]
MSILKTIVIMVIVYFCGAVFAGSPMVKKFDHDFHDKNVFEPKKVDCSYCHNMEKDKETGVFKMTSGISMSTFQRPLKQICHECHKVADSKYNPAKSDKAPKACYTCHDSFQQIAAIKPQSHQNKLWKKIHGMSARAESVSCTNCHTPSQCSTCHTQRNDLMPKNHMRNFRFFHSVEARMAPQKCDACHNKTYCTTCHMGKK